MSKLTDLTCKTCSEPFKARKRTALYCDFRCYPSYQPALHLRESSLQSKYGMSIADYNKRFEEQKGLCLGCYQHQANAKKTFHIDHSHKTGKVRGLLCNECNRALGASKDSPSTLRRLADYLERNA